MLTLHPMFAARLKDLELEGRDTATVKRNRYALKRLSEWLTELSLDPKQLARLDVQRYKAHLRETVAETTANREFTMVKATYKFAVEDIRVLEQSPFAGKAGKAPEVRYVPPARFTPEELRTIRASIRDDLEEAIFYALAYSGLRRAELVGLRWIEYADRDREGKPINCVDFEVQEIRVIGKNGTPRNVPLHPLLAKVLKVYRERHGSETVLGPGGSLRNVNQRVQNLLRRAGVDGGNRPAHRFRKTVASALYKEGVRTDTIDRLMGWAAESMRARHYVLEEADSLYDAMLRLYESDPIERPPVLSPGEARALRKAV